MGKAPNTKVNTLPPKEIYDVLHEFEERGGTLPESVDNWWFNETNINEIRKEALKPNKGGKTTCE